MIGTLDAAKEGDRTRELIEVIAGQQRRTERDLAIKSKPSPSARSKLCIIVAGMHRSGTSATARVVNLLGAHIAGELVPASAGDNDRGFWESPRVVQIHEHLLETLGSSYDTPFPVAENWIKSTAARKAKRQLVVEIQEEFQNSAVFVVKDPRIALLLPMWLQVLDTLQIECVVIVPFRNPLEVAESLRRRNSFALAKSLLMYTHSNLEVELASRGRPRIFLPYDQLLADWRPFAGKLRELSSRRIPAPGAKVTREINHFLTRDLHRNRFGYQELRTRSDIGLAVVEIFNRLTEAASIGKETELRASFDHLRATFAEAGRLYKGLAAAEAEKASRHLASIAHEVSDRDRRLRDADGELRRFIAEIENRGERLTEADRELRRFMAEREDRDRRLAGADVELRRLVAEVENREERLTAADRELRTLMAEVNNLEERLTAADGQLRHLVAEVDDRNRRLTDADGELRRLIAEIEQRDRQLIAADGQLRHLMGEVEDRERRLADADGELRRLITEIADRDRRLVAADGQLRHLVAEVDDRNRRLTDADGELRRLIAEIEQRDRQLIAADGQLRHLVGEVEDRERRLTVADSNLGRLRSEAQDSERKLTANDHELRRLVAEAEDRNRRLGALDNERRQLIKDLEERGRRLDLAEADRQRLIAEAKDRAQQLAVAEQRLKNIEASRSWRMITAIQRFLPGKT